MKKHTRIILVIICLSSLVSLPACGSEPTDTTPVFETPTAYASGTPVGVVTENCYYNWATQSLPQLSARVQSDLESAGLTDIRVTAEAYGENCYGEVSNEILGFTALETDYRITVLVKDIRDRQNMGEILERVLNVLDQVPPDITPGRSPGYIGVIFQTGDDTLHLWFLESDGKEALARDLHGAELLDYLEQK